MQNCSNSLSVYPARFARNLYIPPGKIKKDSLAREGPARKVFFDSLGKLVQHSRVDAALRYQRDTVDLLIPNNLRPHITQTIQCLKFGKRRLSIVSLKNYS